MEEETIQDRAKLVRKTMEEWADSLDFLAEKIIDPDAGPAWIQDFAYAVLKERVERIRERATELFRDLGVNEPNV